MTRRRVLVLAGSMLVLIIAGACISLISLCVLGRSFGIRPALRALSSNGPYGLIRHPLYLAYMLADVGYDLQECNAGVVLLTAAGWASLIYRIAAEERVLSRSPRWTEYVASVRSRLLPGIW